MKEYKFRGRRVDDGKWVIGDLIQYNEKVFIYPLQYRKVYTESIQYEPYCRIRLKAIEVIPETVGQYTEQNDMNDHEIYDKQWIKFIMPVDDPFWGKLQGTLQTGQITYEPEKGGYLVYFAPPGSQQNYVRFNCDIACECEIVENLELIK